MIKIIADENIPYVREAFEALGNVQTVAGRAITHDMLQDADVLLVRSVTRVNRQLLAGTKVRMVATATIGTDHIDQGFLIQAGISFSSAAGCNSNSVAEYITAALLTLGNRKGFSLTGKSIGVVGVGNVGTKVVDKCSRLGMRIYKNDPPLKDLTGSDEYCEIDDFIESVDFVTLHVPLTTDGLYPTFHLADDTFIGRMKSSAFLLNTSRGKVVDGDALKSAISDKKIAGGVLDVWENEPDIDISLLRLVVLGTPHIAGYSFDGKVCGTDMIYQAVCKFLNIKPLWNSKSIMPAPPVPNLRVDGSFDLHSIIKKIYDIESDDANLRKIIQADPHQRAKYFDSLRKNYPVRREFYNTNICFDYNPDAKFRRTLEGIGFKIC